MGGNGLSGSAAVIGLGSMGYGMAVSLMRAGAAVAGYDPAPGVAERFAAEGGRAAASPGEAARGADAMAADGVFVSCATMAPDRARALAKRLEATGRHYLDAPMSGGAARAADGSLTMLASGSEAAFARAQPALDAMTGKLYRLGDAAGQGAAFKMVNQLLAGVHIAAACEAIAFARREGLDLARVFEVITASAGNSWMFENRVPHILDGDYAPKSAVEIFVKDLGIVIDMARASRFPVPVAGAALQMFLMTAAAGMGRDDDASVARLYARIAGLDLPGQE